MKSETTMEIARDVFPMMVDRIRDQAISYVKLARPLRTKREKISGLREVGAVNVAAELA
jgi:hypothetical protein